MTRLDSHQLGTLPETVAVPGYDRSSLTPGIAHFGVGGFHRAHQALVVDRLLHNPAHRDWAIVGIGVREPDRRMRDALEPQQGLYTLTEKDMQGHTTRVIGSIVDYRFAPDDPHGTLELLAQENIKIVSLTITEGGYNFNQVTGEFDWSTAEIAADVDSSQPPVTVFGYVVQALALRRSRGIEPFTVMSCDNIQGNGHLAKKMFVAFATRVDPELARWMSDTVAFPNSMVDRITPVTTDEDVAAAAAILGVEDAWPVVCETFFQWVLEDDFPSGRPPFEDAGVQLVNDVEPYELMKLRLLNASHQALAYFGHLLGYRLVHEAVLDPLIETLLRRYMAEEARPTLRAVPGVDLDAYCDTLIARFTNAEVKDTIARLCAESSDRIPKWLVPVIRENLAAGRPTKLSAAIVASWARYAEGVDDQGTPIEVVDNLLDELVPLAQSQRSGDELAFIKNTRLFGDLAENAGFAGQYRDTLQSLWDKGARVTLEELVS